MRHLCVLTYSQSPIIQDVCIFCLTRTLFATVHALRRPQRRLLSASQAFRRPSVNAVAQKEEEGVPDPGSVWEGRPPRRLGGGWARTNTTAPSDLTAQEKALRNALRNESTEEIPGRTVTSMWNGDRKSPPRPSIHEHESSEQNQPLIRYENVKAAPIFRLPKPIFSSHTAHPNPRPPLTFHMGTRRVPAGAVEIPSRTTSAQVSQAISEVEGQASEAVIISPPPPPALKIRWLSPKMSEITSHTTQQEGYSPDHALAKESQAVSKVEGQASEAVIISPPPPPAPKIRWLRPKMSEITSHTTQQEGYLPDHALAEESQAVSKVERQARPVIIPSTPPTLESQKPQRPRFGSWPKREVATDLTQAEHALREDLQKRSASRPHLPAHEISPAIEQTKSPKLQSETFRQSKSEKCGHYEPPISSISAQQQSENAKHWKHVRVVRHGASPETSQPERFPAQGRLEDPQAIARARAIEQGKMERMEKTKGGEFVGLRRQYESATSKAVTDAHWPFEARGPQVPDVEPATSNTGDPAETASDLPAWEAQSTTKLQLNKARTVRDEGSDQEDVDRLSKARLEAIKPTGGWKRWEPPSIEMQHRSLQLSSSETTSNTGDLAKTGSVLVPWRAQSATNLEADKAQAQPTFLETSQYGRSDQAEDPAQPASSGMMSEQYLSGNDFATKEKLGRTRREPQGQPVGRHSTYKSTIDFAGGSRDKSRRSKKVISSYDDADEEDIDFADRRMERKKQQKKARAAQKAKAPATPIYLPGFISVSNLARALKVRVEDFTHKMEDLGFEDINNDHVLDAETAGLVAAEFNFEPIVEQAEDQNLFPRPPAEDKSVLPPRPPVVTIMGHVDHGKTTLLDYLRKSSVAASEHGGITQHIGAFSVPMSGGRLVTFLDTPGHEAFLSMRQRGANVTDIVILVVAADDSVKPQTIEAIRHAQAAKVPMIVAVNKIDKEDSNVERVKQDLARYSVEIEDYGGDTQVVCVSGKTGQGMEELEDAAVALADVLDMRSETDGQAEGWVIEATTKKAGRVATVLVKRGTIRPGDIIVAGTSWARIRSLRNEAGVMLGSAGPGTPIEIDGWREQPSAGDEVLQAPDEQRAKAVVDYRLKAHEQIQMATDMAAVNEARRLEQAKREQLERAAEFAETNSAAAASTEGQVDPSTPSFQEVFFIVKADVSGSVEAVADAISALGNNEVRPHILRTGVGPVTESDVDHAAVAKGHIVSFNTSVDGSVRRMAEAQDVQILDQNIIYRLIDDVKAKLGEKLPEIITQTVVGEAEVAQTFEINTKGRTTVPVAGCKVRNGVIGRNNKVRVLRNREVIYDGTLRPNPPRRPPLLLLT